ncbi:MAG: PTS sugar transporter subunit IIC [Deltaproteobacteria bacterium]|jgi:PTS system mannose-specific IIC component|nr:PTS sugar transporter subunit IIC [Deltaproteobacteria bacterium]
MEPEFWLALLLAALINLDRQALGQIGLSRPVATGALMGLLLDQALAGLTLGLWTELLWLTKPPLGGAMPPNGGLAVSAALLGFQLLGRPLPSEKNIAGYVFLLIAVIPMAHLMAGIEVASRRNGEKLTLKLKQALAAGLSPDALSFQLRGLGYVWLLGLLFVSIGSLVMAAWLKLGLTLLPESFWTLLYQFGPLTPLIGVATMTNRFDRSHLILFFLTLAVSLAVLWSTAWF